MPQELILKKKELLSYLLSRNYFANEELLETLLTLTNPKEIIDSILEKIDDTECLVLNKDIIGLLKAPTSANINWKDMEQSRAQLEKGKSEKLYSKFVSSMQEKPDIKKKEHSAVQPILNYKLSPQKRNIQDFVKYFYHRYKALEKVLKDRKELVGLRSINRISSKKERENVSLVGIVSSKAQTKNKNIMLTMEDPTGTIKVLINKNRKDLYEKAEDIVEDEVLGIVGVNGNNIVFANNIVWPEVPLHKEFKKAEQEEFALFLSDIHVGSKNFLAQDFEKFLAWINQKVGNEKQKAMASKVKYIFIVGDLVDGTGIYPNQEEELEIKDVVEQYNACAELLLQIPKHINIIICGGNHDAMRISEPQPPLNTEYAKQFYDMENVTLVSNPSLVNIGSSAIFPGFDVLLYHGYSFDHYVANVSSIRNMGGYNRADLIMKFLLKRRHLAPTHTSTLYIPDTQQDPLVISKIPDIFVTGHIHKSIAVPNYRSISLICGSCWQSKTSFQEKVGHDPQPSRVPAINLKTREISILKFGQ